MTAPLLTTRDLGDLSPSTAKRIALAGLTPMHPAIARIVSAINTDPGRVPRVARLVAWSRLGADGFRVAFMAATGVTVQRYLIDARMRVARDLLDSTDLDVRLIAGRVGYFSREQFSAAFLTEMGMTPTQYRERVRP